MHDDTTFSADSSRGPVTQQTAAGQPGTALLRLAHWQIRRRQDHPRRGRLIFGLITGLVVTVLGAGAAFAYWTATGSGPGEAQSATVTNLSITAVSATVAHTLYPGATGDVVLTITNPNTFPVTITAVNLPTSSTYAAGYVNSNLTGSIPGCSATAGSSASDVVWTYSSGTSGSSHSLTSNLTVGASGTLTVTMTNDASMTASSPAACEAAYFQMPSLIGVTATSSTNTATASPATDSWTN